VLTTSRCGQTALNPQSLHYQGQIGELHLIHNDLAVGKLDKPNTGREVYFSRTTIFTLKDRKIVDEVGEEQALTALQQLGLVSAPNPGKDVKYDAEGNHI
jgi:hypothetical protein